MAEDRNTFSIQVENDGSASIGDEVIAIIAGIAACEVEGVVSLAGNLTQENISKAGAGKLSKAVKIVVDGDDQISAKISINVKYGYSIAKIGEQAQEKVKAAIENMTGLEVLAVDIRVSTVNVDN